MSLYRCPDVAFHATSLVEKGGALEQSGEYEIGASREKVWAALNDPDVLGGCIAGCQNVDKIDAEHFDVSVKAKIR